MRMTPSEYIAKFHYIESIFFSGISSKTKDFDGGVTAYFTNVKSQYLNPVFHKSHCAEISSIVKTCANIYKAEKLPWVWVSKADLMTQELENALEKIGATLKYVATTMMCDLKKLENYTPSQMIDIRCTQNLTDWIIPVYQAFEATEEIGMQYKKAHERTESMDNVFFHIVGYIDSKPVCALTLTIWQGTARIDDVGTIPSNQRCGYGTEILRYALSKAKNLGADTCFLETSEQGKLIYSKIGFKPLFENKYYGKFAA